MEQTSRAVLYSDHVSLSQGIAALRKNHICRREEESTEVHGHITSLSVLRSHRKLGIASRLMDAARKGNTSF